MCYLIVAVGLLATQILQGLKEGLDRHETGTCKPCSFFFFKALLLVLNLCSLSLHRELVVKLFLVYLGEGALAKFGTSMKEKT